MRVPLRNILNFTHIFKAHSVFACYKSIKVQRERKMERRAKRVSASQWDIALEFLEQNPTIVRGYHNSSRGRELSQRLWQELAELLNAEGSGATKTPKDWATYFNNFKSKLKKMLSDLNADAIATGGGPPRAESITDTEQRFLAIMGPGFGQGIPNVRVNPFPNMQVEQGNIEPPAPAEEESLQNIVLEEIPLEDMPIQAESEEVNIGTFTEPQPSTSGNFQQASVRSPPSANTTTAPPVQRRTRRTRYHTRPMAPLDEARRILSQVEMRRAAADAEQARALHLIAQNLGRLADAADRYLARNGNGTQ